MVQFYTGDSNDSNDNGSCDTLLNKNNNKRVSQMLAPLAACNESVGSYSRLSYVLYFFEYKTQCLLIHDTHTPYCDILTYQ